MDDFDLEKIEALDFDSLSGQLQYIFKTEEDIANFCTIFKECSTLYYFVE